MDEPRFVYVPPELLLVSPAEFGAVLDGARRYYQSVSAGVSEDHAAARAYYGGMVCVAEWMCGLHEVHPMAADQTLARDLAGVATLMRDVTDALYGPNPRKTGRHWAVGVQTMLGYMRGMPRYADLPERLRATSVRAA